MAGGSRSGGGTAAAARLAALQWGAFVLPTLAWLRHRGWGIRDTLLLRPPAHPAQWLTGGRALAHACGRAHLNEVPCLLTPLPPVCRPSVYTPLPTTRHKQRCCCCCCRCCYRHASLSPLPCEHRPGCWTRTVAGPQCGPGNQDWFTGAIAGRSERRRDHHSGSWGSWGSGSSSSTGNGRQWWQWCSAAAWLRL